MKQSNTTGNQSWIERLEALTELPGEERRDVDAAWERIEARVNKKPGRNKLYWYGAAAACLLAVGLSWLFYPKKDIATLPYVQAGDNPVKQKEVKKRLPVEEAQEKEILQVQPAPMIKPAGKELAINKKKRGLRVRSVNKIEAGNMADSTAISMMKTMTVPETTAVKKVRVAHFNRVIHHGSFEDPVIDEGFLRNGNLFKKKEIIPLGHDSAEPSSSIYYQIDMINN